MSAGLLHANCTVHIDSPWLPRIDSQHVGAPGSQSVCELLLGLPLPSLVPVDH
jgi:hypothetical protein